VPYYGRLSPCVAVACVRSALTDFPVSPIRLEETETGEVEPGKQSGVTDPACPCRAVEARPQKRTHTTQLRSKALATTLVAVSGFEVSFTESQASLPYRQLFHATATLFESAAQIES
jgi:hypothetical protein